MRPVKDVFSQNAQAFERLLESEKRRGQLTRRLLTAVVVLILLMLNVSHCSEQSGINRTVVASETAASNTDTLAARQREQINELRANRLADSVVAVAQAMQIQDLEHAVAAAALRAATGHDVDGLAREVRIDRQYVAAVKEWQQVNVGRLSRITDSLGRVLRGARVTVLTCKTDTLILTKTDTVTVSKTQYAKVSETGRDSTLTPLPARRRPRYPSKPDTGADAKKRLQSAEKAKRKRQKAIKASSQNVKKAQRRNQRRMLRKQAKG